MKAIVRFTLRQQVLFNLVFALTILVGFMALGEITIERYPDVNLGKVQIATLYPGASPGDVEALVTREIEEALEGLEEVEYIQSTSVRERSVITVKFRDDSNYDALYNELRFRVLGALDELPAMVEPPVFTQWTTSAWLPVVVVNLVGERSNRALALMAEQLRAEMARIPGVSEARLSGDWTREFQIWLDPAKLSRHGITFDEVATALRDANQVIPAGDFSDASGEFVVRVDERFRTSEQVAALLVRADSDGSFVRLDDLIARADLASDPALAPYLTQLDAGRAAPARVLRLSVDAERAGELGLTQGRAIALAASVLDGRYLGKFRLPDEEVDIKLGLDPAGINRAEAPLATPVLEDLEGPVRLGDVVRLSHLSEPSELRRYQGLRSRVLTANIETGAPISAVTVVAWAREREGELSARYPGAHLIFGGEFEDTQRSFESLTRAFFIAILLIYLILAVQFRSYLQPALILSAVMFAIIGVVFGKLISQSLGMC